MQRVTTGNPELDHILCGGLPRHSINIISGLPGCGKTILAQQLVFACGTGERPALYLSTASEPHVKIVSYLQELTFVDVQRIGTDVIYDSLVDATGFDSDAIVQHMTKLIQKHRPVVIVIDSFKALGELVVDPVQWRQLAFEIARLLAAYDVMGVWVGEYGSDASPTLPEFAIADGILELQRRQSGSHDERYLRVMKLRGSDFRDGEHAFELTNAGLRVFPRLVAPSLGLAELPAPERLKTGVAGLDDLIEHGWLRGTSTLVAGPSGAGKTVLGLQFLRQGVIEGEPGLLVNFQESPLQLVRGIESFGWDAAELLKAEKVDVLYTSPAELHIDHLVQDIMRRIDAHGARRIVIDALGDVQRASSDKRRFFEYMYILTQEFARRQITAILILEITESNRDAPALGSDVSYMSDNILALSMDFQPELTRTIRIIKTRASGHYDRSREISIDSNGMSLI